MSFPAYRPRYYRLLPDHSVEPLADILEDRAAFIAWAEAFESNARQVARTEVAPGIEVSTVFLGLDHNHGGKGPPLLFETMTFDDYEGGDCWRWSTWDEALAGHEMAVAGLKRAIAAVDRKKWEKGESR
jgi:hypothetical protein